LTVQLDGSIAGSVAKMLGWENVASGSKPLEKNPDAAPYSMETLVAQNPEIIFVTSMGKLEAIKASMEETMQGPAWQSIPAVKNKQVYYLPQELFLLSPGIHYPEAVATMAKCVYPDVK
jgi:iron complex transport system substrate-binding protein